MRSITSAFFLDKIAFLCYDIWSVLADPFRIPEDGIPKKRESEWPSGGIAVSRQ